MMASRTTTPFPKKRPRLGTKKGAGLPKFPTMKVAGGYKTPGPFPTPTGGGRPGPGTSKPPVTDGGSLKQRQRKAARQSLKNAGITRAYLAKTTGTTKTEGGGLMSSQVKAFMKNQKIGSQVTQVTRNALAGGPSGGVKAQPKKAGAMVRKARKNYRQARRTSRSW